jgi:hypothetical protein
MTRGLGGVLTLPSRGILSGAASAPIFYRFISAHWVSSLFLDQPSILPWQFYAREIIEAIASCDLFLLLTSKHSIGNTKLQIGGSEEVANEVELARRNGNVLF